MAEKVDVVKLWQDSQEVLEALTQLHRAIADGEPHEAGPGDLVFPEEREWWPSVAKATKKLVFLLEEPRFKSWAQTLELDWTCEMTPPSARELLDGIFSYVMPYIRGVTTQLGLGRFRYIYGEFDRPGYHSSAACNKADAMVCGLRRAIAGLEKDETLKEWLFEQSKQMLLEIPEESSEQAEWWDKPLQLTYDPPPNEPLTLTHDNIPGVDVPDGIPLFPEAPAHADNPTGSEPIVGEAHNWANDPLTRRFVVSLSPPQVTIDGTAYALEDKAAEFLNGLMKDQDWVSGSSIVNQPSRVRDHMPPEVQRWIKSGSGKGFRITPPK